MHKIIRHPALFALLLTALSSFSALAQSVTSPTLTARRIVSLVPQDTEALFALGAQDRLVGVSTSSQWPPEARKLPQMGDVRDVEIDKILAAKPDLVLLSKSHIEHNRALRAKGVRTLTLDTDSINQALWMIHDLSFIVGKQEVAKKLLLDMAGRLNALDAKYKKMPKRRVLMSFYHEPDSLDEVLAVGPGNYLDEVMREAGGQNVLVNFDPEGAIMQAMKAPAIKQAHPEVVIDLQDHEISDAQRQKIEGEWRALLGDQAKIVVVYDPYIGVPGIHIPETIEKLGQWIHGTAASEPTSLP